MREFSEQEIQHVKQYIADYPLTATGRLFYYFIPHARKVVSHNIDFAFGQFLSAQEKTKLTKAIYCHYVKMIKEVIFSLFKNSKVNKTPVKIIGREYFDAAEAKNKGVALLTGHFGNWELTAMHVNHRGPEYAGKLHVFRKNLGVAWAQKLLFKRYQDHGMNIIPFNKHALIRAVKALKRNEMVLFVLDQFARVERNEGVEVDFFGKKTGTYRSLAAIVQRTGTPVVPCTSYRTPQGTHVIEFLPELTWLSDADPEQEILRNTQNYNHIIEDIIIQHPEQWLWFYDRWKNIKK